VPVPIRTLALAAGCAATAGVIATSLVAGSATAGPELGAPTGAVAAAPDPADQSLLAKYAVDQSKGSQGLALPTDIRLRADSLMRTNLVLAPILADHDGVVSRQGTWTRLNGQTIGVIRELEFSQPFDIPMRYWPAIRYNEDPAVDTYTQHSYQAAVSNITRLTLFIDLQKGVVGIH
jgi:hypothetical protein